MKKEQLQYYTITALFAALLCLLAPLSIPLGTVVPISLATFVIYLLSGILEPKYSVISVLIYILLGAIGLPVFAGYNGGFQNVIGVTGGYIIGYIPLALIVSFTYKLIPKKWFLPISMIIGTVVLYTLGTIWFIVQTKSSLASALTTCVIPFIVGDLIKIVASSAIVFLVKDRIIKLISKK